MTQLSEEVEYCVFILCHSMANAYRCQVVGTTNVKHYQLYFFRIIFPFNQHSTWFVVKMKNLPLLGGSILWSVIRINKNHDWDLWCIFCAFSSIFFNLDFKKSWVFDSKVVGGMTKSWSIWKSAVLK